MRAVWLREFGGPEVLVAGEAPDPVPGPGQVLVEVAFVNVTFVETQFRASGFGPVDAALPMIPGNGVGGVISKVGDGVDLALVGRGSAASSCNWPSRPAHRSSRRRAALKNSRAPGSWART
jgi:NADPH2:quinone reductase